MFVIPKAGSQISDPAKGDLLPEKGREVPKNQYWLRRINDGDVTIKKSKKKR